MWSFSFAGSMSSSTAAIGRAVGVGEGVGAKVGGAVVPGLAAKMEGDGLAGEFEAPPHAARRIARTTRRRPTMPVYRARAGSVLGGRDGRRGPRGLRFGQAWCRERERGAGQRKRQSEIGVANCCADACRPLLDAE